MKIIQDKYKKVADFCFELFRIAKLPLHASRFSNKLFSQFQHLFLLVYKQFRKATYEELLTDLASNYDLRAYLGLQKLPHYSTLIKFAKRLPATALQRLLEAFKRIIPKPKIVAIDATGISLDNASPHYCKRIGLRTKKRPFMKTTFIVDIQNFMILLCNTRKKARHDVRDAKPMIKRLALHYRPEVFLADRGYDAESLFALVFEKLGAYTLIFQRNQDVPKHRKSRKYRKATINEFDYGGYLQRNLIETTNSMIKKRFSSKVLSKINKMQKVEILTRVIAYNIDRLIRMSQSAILIFIRIARVSH